VIWFCKVALLQCIVMHCILIIKIALGVYEPVWRFTDVEQTLAWHPAPRGLPSVIDMRNTRSDRDGRGTLGGYAVRGGLHAKATVELKPLDPIGVNWRNERRRPPPAPSDHLQDLCSDFGDRPANKVIG
jgi:hypothetical protein